MLGLPTLRAELEALAQSPLYPTPWYVKAWHRETCTGEDHGIAIKAANHAVVVSYDDVTDNAPPDSELERMVEAVNERAEIQERSIMERNVAAINELADFVESAKFKFDMADIANPACGSAGCIGGHASVLWPELQRLAAPFKKEGFIGFDDDGLARKLGISYGEESCLCYLEDSDLTFSDITRPIAVAALRRLAATGEVRFDLADDKPSSPALTESEA